jgi:hypothetical protein
VKLDRKEAIMSQVIKTEYVEANEAHIAPTTPGEELDLSNYLFLSPEDEASLLEVILDPPELNPALLRAKESYNRLFEKDI